MAKKNNGAPLSECFTGKSLNQLFECLRTFYGKKNNGAPLSECFTGKSLNQLFGCQTILVRNTG